MDHGDAHHLAIIKKAESNMARCYLAHCERIAELEAALRHARAQLVTLGGEALHPHGDNIQRAVLVEIDRALAI